MLDPVVAVAVAAVVLTSVSMMLSRIIPDRYDSMELSRIPVRRR
jgi:uncharacterized membrane protein YjjB (DUF3815 family)